MNTISIIVPVYNSEKTIQKCIDSIQAQELPQSWKMEILVIDNNSSDRSLEVLKQFTAIKILNEKEQSPSAARNKGLKKSSGELVAFIDSDVYLAPKWVLQSILKITSGPYAGGQGKVIPIGKGFLQKIRYTSTQYFTNNSFNYLYTVFQNIFSPAINSSAAIYKREWLENVGGFRTTLSRLEDRDLATRIYLAGGIFCEVSSDAFVSYSNNVFHFYSRYLHNGFNYPKTIMNQLPRKEVKKLDKRSYLVSLHIMIATLLFNIGLRLSSLKKNEYSSKVNLSSKFMKFSIYKGAEKAEFLRLIELNESLYEINLASLDLKELSSTELLKS